MRFDGTLDQWNDERGFGFIAPTQGGQEIFVHVSAFPRDGLRPRLEERLSFEIELNPEGKKRAIKVQRPMARPAAARPVLHERSSAHRGAPRRAVKTVSVLLALALAAYAWTAYSRRIAPSPALAGSPAAGSATERENTPATSRFSCDGRTRCTQMTSCAEAMYFLAHCPGVEMDGNNDGVPCEMQWCHP